MLVSNTNIMKRFLINVELSEDLTKLLRFGVGDVKVNASFILVIFFKIQAKIYFSISLNVIINTNFIYIYSGPALAYKYN